MPDEPLTPMTEADLAAAIHITVAAMRARGEIKAATAADGFAKALAAKLWRGNVRAFRLPPYDPGNAHSKFTGGP